MMYRENGPSARRSAQWSCVRKSDPPTSMLRIGLLVDSTSCSKYVYELTKWAQDQDALEISHLIVQGNTDESLKREARGDRLNNEGAYALLGKLAWRVLIRFEEFLLIILARRHLGHYKSFDLSRIVKQQVAVDPIKSSSGLVQFSKSDVDKISSLGLDLLIWCGSGVLRGDVLTSCKLGVLSMHHHDIRVNRGGLAGFWECYYRCSQTGFIIQQLTEDSEAGNVILRGAFRTNYLFSINQAELYTKSTTYLKDILKRIAVTNVIPPCETQGSISDQILLNAPSFHQMIIYAGKLLSRIMLKLVRRVVGLQSKWSIALLEGSFEKAALWRSKEIHAPRGRYWADPFLWRMQNRTYCFVEDYVYREERGYITALEIISGEVVERGVAIKENFHLSFPFIFEYNNEIFICPESSEAKQIRVYGCQKFPLQWSLRAVLMDGVSAVDTMIFEKAGKWWMLTSLDRSSTGDYCCELNLFSASSPLDTKWASHPKNPIKINSFGGRNAGLIVKDGKLYRLGQRQGFDLYGEGLMIFEITKLTESEYEETLLQDILPKYRKGLRGVHHMTSDGCFTIIDQGRLAFTFPPTPAMKHWRRLDREA